MLRDEYNGGLLNKSELVGSKETVVIVDFFLMLAS